MPLLLLIICVLVVCSFSMPGSSEGLAFLLRPDFSKVDGKVVLDAMGQAFFSMSVGMGCLCTYASYFTRDANLVKTAGSVALIDTFVAVLAGFIIFRQSIPFRGCRPMPVRDWCLSLCPMFSSWLSRVYRGWAISSRSCFTYCWCWQR